MFTALSRIYQPLISPFLSNVADNHWIINSQEETRGQFCNNVNVTWEWMQKQDGGVIKSQPIWKRPPNQNGATVQGREAETAPVPMVTEQWAVRLSRKAINKINNIIIIHLIINTFNTNLSCDIVILDKLIFINVKTSPLHPHNAAQIVWATPHN